ncbi:MAG: hypothetical protein CM15mP102_02820 [Flavobacteriales bacterium]|nr:MAG: hypothetical protein CM15mP102_02820 [Flavobacteriales bacterium]
MLAGGDRQKDLCNESPKSLERQILSEILPLLRLKSEPEFKNHFRWPEGYPPIHVIEKLKKGIEFLKK